MLSDKLTFEMHISELYVYPVKSLAGIKIDSANLQLSGLKHDRQWMLVQSDGQFISQRSQPQLALVETRLTDECLVLSTFGMEDHSVDGMDINAGRRIKVKVWNDVVEAVAHDDVTNQWLSQAIDSPCILVSFPKNEIRQCDPSLSNAGDHTLFADGFPLLMISQASLNDLNHRLETPVGMDRFRPNIVVEGCDPYAEDSWGNIVFNDIKLRMVKACARCSIPTVDQQTGMVCGPEPIHTLSGYRQRDDGKIYFGVNLIPENTGIIRCGDVLSSNNSVR